MAKNLKVTVKNSQLAEALKLTKVKKGPPASGAKKEPVAEKSPSATHEKARAEPRAEPVSPPPTPVVEAPSLEPEAPRPPRKREREAEEAAVPAKKRPSPPAEEEEKAPAARSADSSPTTPTAAHRPSSAARAARAPAEEAPLSTPREQTPQAAVEAAVEEERALSKEEMPAKAPPPPAAESTSPSAPTSHAPSRPKIGSVRPPLAPPPGMRPSFGEKAPADRFVSPPRRTGAGGASGGGYAGGRPNRFASPRGTTPPATGVGAGGAGEERRYTPNSERRERTGGYERRPSNGYQGGAPSGTSSGGYQGGANRPYTPRTGTSGYGTPRAPGSGYTPRPPGSGYTPRPPSSGYGGPRPAGGGYAGQRPRPPGAAGGYRGPGGARPPIGPPATGEKPSTERHAERGKMPTFKEFREVKSQRKTEPGRGFDARDRQGRREGDEDLWKRKRPTKSRSGMMIQEEIIRPKSLSVHLPITVKDLASGMKLKASEIISKLFIQGIPLTLNELLDDETTVQLIGNEFDCEISIDRVEQNRVQVTAQNVREEVAATPAEELMPRCPVVAFMGHVDHGKTSLIDRIRKSNMAAGEAGAITQHIGAFRCHTNVGDLTVLDTPGHEAFSAMRSRGAIITDIVVLVVAGDEGIRAQTEEAIKQAREAGVPIVVAMNKCDKPGFDRDTVYRQLADHELLPEAWGGQTIATPCSATTGEGVQQLLELLAVQAEVLELKANPKTRARGTVIESQMHKGLGAVASVLIQNGTLRLGDALVFGDYYARVKTMQDEHGHLLTEAGPATPVKITGLSGLPQAGSEFVVVKDEKEARSISEARQEGKRHLLLKTGKSAILEKLKGGDQAAVQRKSLNLIIKGDVRGSVEALRSSLMKIHSTKVDLNIITAEVGEISESDVQLAAASKATILGFHTQIESHAEQMIKQSRVVVKLHDIIYHAVDEVRKLMLGMLDKVAQERDTGSAEVIAVFKSSQLGLIAGCRIVDGTIHRNNMVRQMRNGEQIWKGALTSMKRVRDDVREVSKGIECGILLQNNNDVKVGDILQAYEMIYLDQEL